MEEFLIGTGVALLLALIGWSEQIRSLHRETLKAERDFSEKRNINWDHVRKIIRGTAPAKEKIVALNKLLREKSVLKKDDIKIINQFYNLGKKRIDIEKLYNIKYILILVLTFLFFISGVINYFIESCSEFKLFGLKVPTEFICIFSCVGFSIGILCFVIHLNNNEKAYRKEFFNLLERI